LSPWLHLAATGGTDGLNVLRERDSGEGVDFDLILDLGNLPASGVVTRTYRAGHNLG